MKPGDLISFPKFRSPDQMISALVLEEPNFSILGNQADFNDGLVNYTTGARLGSFVRVVKVLCEGKTQNWVLDIDDRNLVIHEAR